MLRVVLIGGDQMKALGKAMKEAGDKGLRKNLVVRLKKSAQPILRDLKSEIKTVPITGIPGMKRVGTQMVLTRKRRSYKAARSRGLRRKIAAGIGLEVRTAGSGAGVRFVARTGRLSGKNAKSLPRHIDNPKGWRHPLFGNEQAWYGQRGRPWWWSTIKPHIKIVRREMTAALDDTAAEIARKALP